MPRYAHDDAQSEHADRTNCALGCRRIASCVVRTTWKRELQLPLQADPVAYNHRKQDGHASRTPQELPMGGDA